MYSTNLSHSGQSSPFSQQQNNPQRSQFSSASPQSRSKRLDSSDVTPTDSGHVFNFEPFDHCASNESSDKTKPSHQTNQNHDRYCVRSKDTFVSSEDISTSLSTCSVSKPKETKLQQNSSQSHHTKDHHRSSSRHLSPHAQIMKILIKAGCDVNKLDEYNGTPLHICASRGNLEGNNIVIQSNNCTKLW